MRPDRFLRSMLTAAGLLVASSTMAYTIDYSGERDPMLLSCDQLYWSGAQTQAQECFTDLIFETTDVVAPSCSQLLRLDTQIVEESGYSYQISTQYRAVASAPPGGSSDPPVDPHGLHAPFPSFT